MDLRTLRSILKYIFVILSMLVLTRHARAQQPQQPAAPGVTFGGGRTVPRARPDAGPRPKIIHGIVQDSSGRPLESAHVLVRDTKTNVVRTLTTNAEGVYSGAGFPSKADYEVTAEFRGQTSEKKTVSSYLDREDNVLNFQIKGVSAAADSATPARTAAATPPGPQINTFDLVRLQASIEVPSGVPAPIPAVLLLHGYGEDRAVWNDFKKTLLSRGWAVMTLDLRGHGDSKTKNGVSIAAASDWRTSPHEFPLDLDAAMTWLKTQTRINSNRIAIIGSDVGANLALIASGRFPQVRTVVALNPNLREGQEMAGSAQDYKPRSALIFALNEAEATTLKAAVRTPARVNVVTQSGGTASMLQNKQVADSIDQWLKETF